MSESADEKPNSRSTDAVPPAGVIPEAIQKLGRFTLERELGRGGAGIVYLAEDAKLKRKVAIKVPRGDISADVYRRFLREARAAAALKHPNIVPILEVGETSHFAFIVYEFCPGETLADFLKGKPEGVPASDAAAFVATLAEALDLSHQRGIIHRDLKPANLLLDPAATPLATPRITDFGLAKIFEGQDDETHSGALIGTPAYMSPEQARGDREAIGPASDQFALGIILYELMTGERPFKGSSFMQTIDLVNRCQPTSPRKLRPDIPPPLEKICLRCLRRDPSQRFPSTQALADDLRRFVRGEAVQAKSVGAFEQLLEPSGRLDLVKRSALISFFAVGVLALWCVLTLALLGVGLLRFPHPQKIVLYAVLQVVCFYLPIVILTSRVWRTGSYPSLKGACAIQFVQLVQFGLLPMVIGWTPDMEMEGQSITITNILLLMYVVLNFVNLCFAVAIHPERRNPPADPATK
jgi:hypothetical protein